MITCTGDVGVGVECIAMITCAGDVGSALNASPGEKKTYASYDMCTYFRPNFKADLTERHPV